MGHIQHDTVVITTSDCRPGGLPDIESFRAALPEEYRPLIIGPVPAPLNGYVSYVFLPEGSKTGWGAAQEASDYRAEFAALFNHRYDDGSTHDDVVHLTYGDDHRSEHTSPAAHYLNEGH
ncbi:hypothetical protein [Streptomyces parvus]|uniref:hypothetical protein n=1 Tax=Streptomyces parvus TaxID=66428 RepID=UPI0021016FE8|nr:hypothetical protein [Streptomyces parvus]MCQ1575453.1 hypothetical protein [Streptomyces parvus]